MLSTTVNCGGTHETNEAGDVTPLQRRDPGTLTADASSPTPKDGSVTQVRHDVTTTPRRPLDDLEPGSNVSADLTGNLPDDLGQSGETSVVTSDVDAQTVPPVADVATPDSGTPPPPTGKVFQGNYTISSAESAAALQQYDRVTGTLQVSDSFKGSELTLTVTQIDGDLQVAFHGSLAVVSAPKLLKIGGTLSVYHADAVAELSLPKLQTIGGGVDISFLPALTKLALPSLQSVQGTLFIGFHEKLPDLSLPALSSAGKLVVESNSAMKTLTLTHNPPPPVALSPLRPSRGTGRNAFPQLAGAHYFRPADHSLRFTQYRYAR